VNLRPHEIKNTFRAGIFVGLSGVILIAITMMLSKENSIFERQVFLYTKVANANGLKEGAKVKLKGIRIGSVSSINFLSLDKIEIAMLVGEPHLNWIKENSFVSIKTQGVLGDKFAEISGGSEDSPKVKENARLPTEVSKELKDYISTGETLIIKANTVLSKLDIFMDQLTEKKNIARAISNLERSTGKLDKMLSEENIKSFSSMTNSLSKITHKIENGPGTVHSLLYDDAIHEDIRALLGGAQRNKVLKYFIRESINKSEKIRNP
jgi:phospholipid/cholesterol/gamma-HCH transport system substrate-binding protein